MNDKPFPLDDDKDDDFVRIGKLKPMPEMEDFDLTDDEWHALTLIVGRESPLYVSSEVLESLREKEMIVGEQATDKGREAASYWQPSSGWDYSKDGRTWKSCAVIVSDGKERHILLHAYGPAVDWHIEQYGTDCEELGLTEAPGPGIWIWEGSMGAVQSFSLDYGEDWDHEVTGDWREPTEEEWELIKGDECPWDKETLPKWPKNRWK